MESPLDNRDILYGFDIHGRSEPIRMMYFMSGEKFEDHRINFDDWAKYKEDMPLGAVPVLKTPGGTFNQSNVIARHVARKHSFMGKTLLEQTLHDAIQENIVEASVYVSHIFAHEMGRAPAPPKSYKETKALCLQVLNLVEKTAKKQGKKYVIGDQIGLAEVWLYSGLQYWKMSLAGITESSDWVKEFLKKMEAEDVVQKYLEQRPPNLMPPEVFEKLEKLKLREE